MKRTSMYKVLATTAILGQTLVGAHHQQQNTYDKTQKNFAFTNFAEDVEKDFKDKPKVKVSQRQKNLLQIYTTLNKKQESF
ncbi:hypothetical protein BK708_02845 [Bacillus thuringiensis serovar yunnanensis]|nr:hypothetical protein BK708_02845 [Bacillus thuringiensis serovar yunnanensis]